LKEGLKYLIPLARIRGIGVRPSQAIEVSPQLTTHTNRRVQGKLFQLSFHWLPACGLKDTRGFTEWVGERDWDPWSVGASVLSRVEASYNFKVLPFVA